MSNLRKNATALLQKRFPAAAVLSGETTFSTLSGVPAFKIWPMIAEDPQSGIKQRAIAVENLGLDEINAIIGTLHVVFAKLDGTTYAIIDNPTTPQGHAIDTRQMAFAPRILLYTNKLQVDIRQVIDAFSVINILIDVTDESEKHKTLFISYGGPDEEVVGEINKMLRAKGITTWFFKDNARPGEKLHRMMSDGVNKYDYVLLVCSKASLSRPGVLNEIERCLEREAKEGGSTVLIPVTLDGHVFKDWAPSRQDLADQIRSRVITKITTDNKDEFNKQINKLVAVLQG